MVSSAARTLGDPDDADNAGCYMQHQVPPVTNPYMLKNVTAAGQYDNLCRTCHGAGAASDWKSKGKDIRLTSHADGSDTGANVLKEADDTLLLTSDPGKDGTADTLTSQCTGCHSSHSSGTAKLFVSAYSNGAACTTCHLAGDRYDNYTKRGHGKAAAIYQQAGQTIPLLRPCTACHFAMDVTTPNSAGTRKPHAEKSPTGSLQEIYQKKFNLSTAPLPGDAGSDSGKPEWGICIGCHSLSKYKSHQSVEGEKNGCQDCHDEHSEGAGSASNIFMIPEKSTKGAGYTSGTPRAGNEDVIYTVARYEADGVTKHINGSSVLGDFYRADGKGFCDNTECHGATWNATTPGPLSTLMGTSSANTHHSNGYFAAGVDCENCHKHNDAGSGWRATASCDECHASSDPTVNTTEIVRSHLSTNESLATHSAHTTSSLVGDCNVCHPHNGKTVQPGSGVHMDGLIQFGGTKMPSGMPTYGTSFGGDACLGTTNGCHDGDAGDWKLGLANGGDANACIDCHDAGTTNVVDAGKTLDQGGYPAPIKSSATKHTKHIDNNAYVTGDCNDCHGALATTGAHTGHKNGTVETVPALNYNTTGKTCTTTCHVTDTTTTGPTRQLLACTDCHVAGKIGGGANMPASGLHTGTPTITGNTHGNGSWDADGADGAVAADCVTCHTAAPTNPPTAHVNGTFDASIGADDAVLPEVHFNCERRLRRRRDARPAARPAAPSRPATARPRATATPGAGSAAGTRAPRTPTAPSARTATAARRPTRAPTVWTSWATSAGTLARPNMTGASGAGRSR